VDFTSASLDGQRFVYADSGEGPLVVLLHGFPDTAHSWERARGVLNAAGYRTVVPYLRGYHPDTIVPGRGYGGDDTAGDVPRLLDAIGAEQAVLVGHDWGRRSRTARPPRPRTGSGRSARSRSHIHGCSGRRRLCCGERDTS
jgi:pimeloyl-ACP methyl ester carboxylesterase